MVYIPTAGETTASTTYSCRRISVVYSYLGRRRACLCGLLVVVPGAHGAATRQITQNQSHEFGPDFVDTTENFLLLLRVFLHVSVFPSLSQSLSSLFLSLSLSLTSCCFGVSLLPRPLPERRRVFTHARGRGPYPL